MNEEVTAEAVENEEFTETEVEVSSENGEIRIETNNQVLTLKFPMAKDLISRIEEEMDSVENSDVEQDA